MKMNSQSKLLKQVKIIMTIALILNIVAWFIPDVVLPDSHYGDDSWPLHARYHAGATSTLNMVYIILALFITWRAKTHVAMKIRWCALGLAVWNLWALFFAVAIMPSVLGPSDILFEWAMNPGGTHAGSHVAVEGGVILLAGFPALLLLLVAWKLRKQ